jgi:hypothetical protein
VQRTIRITAETSGPDETIRVLFCGLGPIGLQAARLAACKPGIEVVGAVDVREDLVGRSFRDVLGGDASVAGTVTRDLAGALAASKPHVAIVTTSSHLPEVRDQLATIVSAGVNVVSATEELLYPPLHSPAVAEELDLLARENQATIIGTGINPGFIMDLLPTTLSGLCQDIERVEVVRIVDAAQRRAPLQAKVGATLSPEEFERRAEAGDIGHVGLIESIAFVASAFAWEIDRIEEELRPVVAEHVVESDYFAVQPGQVAGIRHSGRGYRGDHEYLSLRLEMYLGAQFPRDAVRIYGTPPIHLEIAGGVHGDLATCAALVNSVPGALAARPGLLSLRDVPVATIFSGRRITLTAE